MNLHLTLPAWVMASSLIYASSAHFWPKQSTSFMFQGLGIRPKLAQNLTYLLPWGEVVLAAALVLQPGSRLSGPLVVVGATLFGLVGIRALRSDHPIRCVCLSSESKATLGGRQIVFAAALIVALALSSNATTSFEVNLLGLVLLLSVVALFRSLEVMRSTRRLSLLRGAIDL